MHLADMNRIDRTLDLTGSPDPPTELLARSLEDAVATSRDRYLAIFELELWARRRPVLGAALSRLGSVATAFTADEHAATLADRGQRSRTISPAETERITSALGW